MTEGTPETSKPPTFLKEFSRQQSPLERTQKAREIISIRRSADQTRKQFTRQLESLEIGEPTEKSLAKINTLKQHLTDLSRQRASVPKQLIDDFYQREERKWESAGYNREDMEKYFSEEHLASLSLPDYILLLKRFPSEMVSHVTRQGIRDHVGHVDTHG